MPVRIVTDGGEPVREVTRGGDPVRIVTEGVSDPVSGISVTPPAPPAEVYLIRDDFTDTLAAGSVNGTAATPGPGTRTVVDSTSVLSVGGGVLDVSGGITAQGDPGIWYDAVTRAAGRLFIIRTTPATVNTYVYSGFHDAQVGAPANGNCFQLHDGVGEIDARDAAVLKAIAIRTATVQNYAISMRGAGAFYFIKSATYPNWEMVWINSGIVTDPMYPCMISYDEAFTVDFIRVPDTLWLPIPIASDSFNRADGVLGNTDGAGHAEANGGGGLAWTSQLGTWAINTNVATSSALDGSGISIATVPGTTANIVAQVTATQAGNEIGMCLRYVDANNYLLIQHDGTNCQLVERVGGVNTTRITAAAAIGAGALLCVLSGADARLYLNSALIGTYAALVDTTATIHGMFTTNIGNTLDNFVVWPRGNEGQYSAIDTWTV